MGFGLSLDPSSFYLCIKEVYCITNIDTVGEEWLVPGSYAYVNTQPKYFIIYAFNVSSRSTEL